MQQQKYIEARIYKATCKTTGKSYIGYTEQKLYQRKRGHVYKSKKSTTNQFYNAINQYGWDDFEWSIVYESWDKKYCLNVAENQLITEFNTLNDGYNSIIGGGVFPVYHGENHPRYGVKHTSETRKKIGQRKYGSGKNNPNAKKIIFKKPNRELIISEGNFKQICREFNLSIATMYKSLYKQKHPQTGRAAGWSCHYAD